MTIKIKPNATTLNVLNTTNGQSSNYIAGNPTANNNLFPAATTSSAGINSSIPTEAPSITFANPNLIITIIGEGTASLLFNNTEIPVYPGTYTIHDLENLQGSLSGQSSTLYTDTIPE